MSSYSANSVKFLFVGRPTRSKGLSDLLAALGHLRDRAWVLTIAGDWRGRPLPELSPAEARFRLLGAVEHALIPALMRDSDVIVAPSRYENFCNVALEGMAAGRAVVGSRCGGIPDLVDDGVTGFLFAPGSVSDLEERLCAVLDAPRKLSMMGAKGWEKARAYSWQEVCRETDALLRQLILESVLH